MCTYGLVQATQAGLETGNSVASLQQGVPSTKVKLERFAEVSSPTPFNNLWVVRW